MKKILNVQKHCKHGITLISLVITIIILLLLAGISIAALSGGNGILTKANIAKDKTLEVADEEKSQLELLYNYTTNRGNLLRHLFRYTTLYR